MLEEFYKNIEACGVSAANGKGFDKLEAKFEKCRIEYQEVFYKEIEKRLKEKQEAQGIALSALEGALK